MRVACVMMQRNEDLCLHPWLVWHGHLFGFENLLVLDHGSDDPGVQEILQLFEGRGVQVLRLPATADYLRKGEFLTTVLRRLEAEKKYDFLFPLDCDEFVTMRDAHGNPNASRRDILAYLSGLDGVRFEVSENFLNILGHLGIFFALPYRKVFFRSGGSGPLDHGSHLCLDDQPAPLPTRFVYAHFHHKNFARQCLSAREKLRPRIDVDDPVALAAFQGPGWHLITHLMKTEAEYLAIMTPNNDCIAFPALNEAFAQLGIPANFAELR
jgi:hypothetical protein